MTPREKTGCQQTKLHNAYTYLPTNLPSSDLSFTVLILELFSLLGSVWISSFCELIFRALASILFRLHAAFSGSGGVHWDSEAFCALDKSDEKSLLWKICFGIWNLACVRSMPGHPTTEHERKYDESEFYKYNPCLV